MKSRHVYTLSLLWFGAVMLSGHAFAQSVQLSISPKEASFSESGQSILTYQITEKSLNENHSRSHYIHPLYTLDGTVITEDFPEDHLHHHGIFWAWHQLYIDDKRIGDGWETKDFRWEVDTVQEMPAKEGAKRLTARISWKSPLWIGDDHLEKAFVEEHMTLTVHPRKLHYRIIDINISLLALVPDMTIGGSENAKGYGGFSARIRLPKRMQFTGPDGPVTPQNLPVNANGWMDFTGALGKDSTSAGLTIIAHRDNPGYPNPWILRAKNSMQNAVYPHPGAQPVALPNTTPTVLQYRLIVHDATLSTQDIEHIARNFNPQ